MIERSALVATGTYPTKMGIETEAHSCTAANCVSLNEGRLIHAAHPKAVLPLSTRVRGPRFERGADGRLFGMFRSLAFIRANGSYYRDQTFAGVNANG